MKFVNFSKSDPYIALSPEADLNLWAMFPEGDRENPGCQQFIHDLLLGFITRLESGDYGPHTPKAVLNASMRNRDRNYGDLTGYYRVNEGKANLEPPFSYALVRQLPALGYMVLLDSEHQKAISQTA